MRITLFVPCFMDVFRPQAAVGMVKVLERLGHSVEFAGELTCCGQPPYNAGYHEEARGIARPVLRRLANADAVVIGSGSCGAMLRDFYPNLFAGEPEEEVARMVAAKCHEFSGFLVNRLGITDLGAEFPHRVTWHDGCHGLRELGIRREPRELLRHVRGLEFLEMDGSDACCGFGGTFAVKYPSLSAAMGEVKCDASTATGAEFIVSGDVSCLLHLQGLMSRSGRPLQVIHLAEILAGTG